MQEEQHDNLLQADGNENQESQVIVNEVIETIDNLNAEVSEDATIDESHDIPMQNYEAMDMDKLIVELEELMSTDKIMAVSKHVEEIKSAI